MRERAAVCGPLVFCAFPTPSPHIQHICALFRHTRRANMCSMNVDSNHKGNMAEAAIMAAAIKAGIPVMKPMVEHTRYDLVFEIESRLYRVQCKWAPFKRGVVVVTSRVAVIAAMERRSGRLMTLMRSTSWLSTARISIAVTPYHRRCSLPGGVSTFASTRP
jgi:hypothetical protein